MILLIDNYDSFTYNIFQYVEELGSRCKVARNDALTLAQIQKMKPGKIIISPGPGDPTESGVSLEVLAHLGDRIPILGVCLGHQAIGHVFGGKVVRAKQLMHGKVSTVKHDGKSIFKGVRNPFQATRYHSLVIERKSLPSCLRITAETDDGVIMGVRHESLMIEGVQFHPESVMTEDGKKLIGNFLAGK